MEETKRVEPETERIMEIAEIEKKLSDMKKKLFTLEWDLNHNQLNPGKNAYYESLKKECEELSAALNKLLSKKDFESKAEERLVSKEELEDESE